MHDETVKLDHFYRLHVKNERTNH